MIIVKTFVHMIPVQIKGKKIQNLVVYVWISNCFYKMAAICPDFKWLGFQITDPI